MLLHLQKLPVAKVRGTYDVNHNNRSDDFLPERMRFLHPQAAKSLLAFERVIIYSDMFRSAEASLAARERKSGVQAPAFSAHNFGLAVDVDVGRTLRENQWTYLELLNFMAKHQWYCYRRDNARGKEDWHFTFLGPDPVAILAQLDPRPWLGRKTWSRAAERAIQQRYGLQFSMDITGMQKALEKLRLYHGAADGKVGPITGQAVVLFARTWGLKADYTDPRFQRVLSYVAADVSVTETT